MTRTLRHDTLGGRHHVVARTVDDETQKPNLRGFKVYIGDFVGVDDPGNDPYDPTAVPPISTSPSSPPWLNGFYYSIPMWFAHGLDGETDMGGMYDLITGGPGGVPPVSGDVAWVCPSEWLDGMPLSVAFPVELDTDVWGMAVQVCDPTTGNVRVFWPLVAAPIP